MPSTNPRNNNPNPQQQPQTQQPAARVVADNANNANQTNVTEEQIRASELEQQRQLRETQVKEEIKENIPDKPGVVGVIETKKMLVPKEEMPEKSDETPKAANRNWNEGDRNEIMQVETAPTPLYTPSQNYQGQPPPPTPGHGEPTLAKFKRDDNGNIMRDDAGNPIPETIGVIQEGNPTVQVAPPIEGKQAKAGMLSPQGRQFGPQDKMQLFAVQLRDNPLLKVAARDRLEAIQVYNQHCGIIRTEHPHSVTMLT
jgi:hypothetical protein